MLSASWYEYMLCSALCVASAGIGTFKQGKKKGGRRWETLFLESPHSHPPCFSLSLLFPPPLLRPLLTATTAATRIGTTIYALLPMPHQSNIHADIDTLHVHSPAVSYCLSQLRVSSTLVQAIARSPKPPSPQRRLFAAIESDSNSLQSASTQAVSTICQLPPPLPVRRLAWSLYPACLVSLPFYHPACQLSVFCWASCRAASP